MTRFTTLIVVLFAVALVSCGRETGPLGIHQGDVINPGKFGKEVTAVDKDWIEFDGRRYSADKLTGLKVECPHK